MKFGTVFARCALAIMSICCTWIEGAQVSDTDDASCCLPVTNKGTKRSNCSHTDFGARQITYKQLYHHNLGLYWWYHDVICEVPGARMAVKCSPYYQKSQRDARLARYFLPCCSSEPITVQEDGLGDIGSLWLSLIAAPNEQYEGSFSLHPEREVVGNFFDIRMSLSPYLCGMWADVAFALEHVRHKLNFCTHDGPFPGTACNVTTLCQAFSQPDWQYGKLWQGELTALGIDDVQLKLGCDWFYCDTNHVSPYIFVGIATRTKKCEQFLFAPGISSGHTSAGFGIIGDVQLKIWNYASLTILTDFKYRRECGGTVKRSFDLCKNGNWSRYLLMVAQDEPANTLPGINFMTQDVKVRGTNVIDWWSALHYKYCQAHVELGYDFWWHEHETVELCSFPEDIGIYDLAGQCSLNPTSASGAMICQSIANNPPASDPTFVAITPCDINLNSGAVPTRLSSTIYIALGYDAYVYEHPLLFGVGVSYEFGHRTSSLSNFDTWAKVGVGF